MQNEKLRALVAELELELSSLKSVDDPTRQRLETAVQEIRKTLAEDAPSTDERSSVVDQLSKAVEDFEGSHPTLVSIIGRLADGLSQMGI